MNRRRKRKTITKLFSRRNLTPRERRYVIEKWPSEVFRFFAKSVKMCASAFDDLARAIKEVDWEEWMHSGDC